MNLLFDTQAFLWWSTDPAKLSRAALAACQDRSIQLILSVVSAWEMQIKLQLCKLTLATPLVLLIERQQQLNNIQVLPVLLPHVSGLATLPPHHKDPFDRLIMAQANAETLVIISA